MLHLTLEAPWETFGKMVRTLFEKDPEIIVDELVEGDHEECDYVLNIDVKNHAKFVALDRVVPQYKVYDNVVLKIMLYDLENNSAYPGIELYETIFKGNPILEDVKALVDPAGVAHGYVRFKPEVVQFFDDNLADYSGNWSGLAEDIAREVFENDSTGMYFCTAAKDKIPEKPVAQKKK